MLQSDGYAGFEALAERVPSPLRDEGCWATERALRAVALGRKNYLFAGCDIVGERAAAIYSLIGTAKFNGLDPQAYLAELLSRIATHPVNRITELLPWIAMSGGLVRLGACTMVVSALALAISYVVRGAD